MSTASVVSLRRYRAHRAAERLHRLPPTLRTPARARPALEAILEYAWEEPLNRAATEPARISRRLEEFVPRAPSGGGQWGLVQWLYDNLVPEAWESPNLLKPLLDDCIRNG
jgi:hypothetical protein